MKAEDLKANDRQNLKKHFDTLYRKKFPWGDDHWISTLVKHSYSKTIEAMELEEYMNDLKLRDSEKEDDY